ncbi:MAG: DUF3592 domain-containing protein [Clostridia bacterium]|nr:DUF3592 domain-containing protein [Clostridia bacterium]
MEDEERNNSLFKTVIAVLWAVVSIGLLIVFSNMGQMGLSLICLGQFFLVFGCAITYKLKKDYDAINEYVRENAPPKLMTPTTMICIIFDYVGLVLFVTGCVLQFGSNNTKNQSEKLLVIAALLLFVMVGVCFLLIRVPKMIYAHKHMTEEVEARVVSVYADYSYDADGVSTIYYSPVWEYTYNGKKYVQRHPVGSGSCKYHMGDIGKIKINPDQPDQIHPGHWGILITGIIAFNFIVMPLWVLVMMLLNNW